MSDTYYECCEHCNDDCYGGHGSPCANGCNDSPYAYVSAAPDDGGPA